MFSHHFGTEYVKDSDNTRVEATGEDWVAGMESHTARDVHGHKVIQLFTGDNRIQHYSFIHSGRRVQHYCGQIIQDGVMNMFTDLLQ